MDTFAGKPDVSRAPEREIKPAENGQDLASGSVRARIAIFHLTGDTKVGCLN